MASRKQARLAEIDHYAKARGIAAIGEVHFRELRERMAPIGEAELRRLLRETNLELAPVVEGVRQEDFYQLERTLLALADEYAASPGNRKRALQLRRLVITAKEHARFAARAAKDKSRQTSKAEMAEWMLVWLENPGVFRQWARLRRRAGMHGAPNDTTPIRSIPP